MNSSNNWINKGIRSNAGPSRTHRSSPPIPAMHRQINHGVMLQRPEEAGMGHGLRKETNRNSDTNFIRSSIRNTSSSDDSIQQLLRFMTVRSISRRKEKQSTGIKGILGQYRLPQWTKPWDDPSEGIPSQPKINAEITLSAESDLWSNGRSLSSNGSFTPAIWWSPPISEFMPECFSPVSPTISSIS